MVLISVDQCYFWYSGHFLNEVAYPFQNSSGLAGVVRTFGKVDGFASSHPSGSCQRRNLPNRGFSLTGSLKASYPRCLAKVLRKGGFTRPDDSRNPYKHD